jgi:membrane-bound lytic murein transglycosylase A
MRQTPRAIAALLLLLAGCASPPPARVESPQPPACPACPACPVCEAVPPKPAAAPLQPARWEDLPGWRQDALRPAFDAFLASCPALAAKIGWEPACRAAQALPPGDAAAIRAFFETRFLPFEVVNPDGTREGLITGYYEPLLKGSRKRSSRHPHAVYGVPDDLLTVELGELHPELKSLRLRGRVEGRKVVPYYSRAQLAQRQRELAGKALYWVADPLDLFFLQVQGSGRIELEDGSRVRVGYADQNGHPYRSIGRWLVDRGELSVEQASLDGIRRWAQANPARLGELLDANPSFVFFRELPGTAGGPPGSLGVPLTEGRSLAVDPRTIPLGAPVFLATRWPGTERSLNRLMVAQDTGGAIKGAVRADYFWGFGAPALAQAGRMRERGRLWVLLPPELAPK